MRNITIRIAGYDISILVFILAGTIIGTAAAATYMWTARNSTITIQEPLTITEYPSIIQTHPGEDLDLNITIVNTATVNYTVELTFTLNNTQYQTNYVTFSDTTYTITPGTNHITAQMSVVRKAPPTTLQLTTQFNRE